MLTSVGDEPAIVVATTGAEPTCSSGFRAVLLLDARAQLQRPSLDAAEDAVRRWFAAARLAAPGAPVVITADNALLPVQALVRWDPAWFARLDLEQRASAGLPPATRMAALVGQPDDIAEVVAGIRTPHRVLGPVPMAHDRRRQGRDDPGEDLERHRALVVVERDQGAALSRELRAITSARSARSRSRAVHVQIDPRDV